MAISRAVRLWECPLGRASDILLGRGAAKWNSGKSAKFTKTRRIRRNSVEILSNTCLYSNFETCLSYWGYLLAVNSQIYVKTSSLKRTNNVLKLPGIDYVAKNWALAMMLKALKLVHFWSVLLLKEQMITSVRKTLKTLVWSAQNRSISSEIFSENNHKIHRFFLITFWPSLPWKFPRNWPIFPRFCPKKIPRNLTFFSAIYQKPWLGELPLYMHRTKMVWNGKTKHTN